MESLDGENKKRLNDIQSGIGPTKIETVEKHKIDGSLNRRHEFVEQMEVGAFQAGFKDTVKHQDNN